MTRPLLILLLALCSAGCDVVESVLGTDRPRATLAGVDFQDIDTDSLTLNLQLDIANPYPVALPLTDLDYSLASRGERFLSGKAPIQGAVPPEGSRRVAIPVTVRFAELINTLKSVRPGSVIPYEATMGLSVDAPQIGTYRLPLSSRGELPVPAPPTVAVERIRWDELTLQRAGGTVTLAVTNPNAFAADLKGLDYALSLAGAKVADASLARSAHFAPSGGRATVEIPLSFSPRSLGLAALRVLQGENADYTLKGATDLSTPFGPMTLPIDASGRAKLTGR